MALQTRNNPAASRYELLDGDEVVGIADYELADGTAVFPHTVISPSRRGEGLGAQLVQAALDDQRREGHKVVPACWYVASFIDEHPQYQDLVA
jgi:predicted GNAT family acetyltransferase